MCVCGGVLEVGITLALVGGSVAIFRRPAKTLEAWTDYPFTALGDDAYGEAPVRKCTVLSWDRDRYCQVLVDGQKMEVKRWYLYQKPGRKGEVPEVTGVQLKKLRDSRDD